MSVPFAEMAWRLGEERHPPNLDDDVNADNPVRVINAYVATLDLRELGFYYTDAHAGLGQPPYNPLILRKLYILLSDN